MQAGRQGRHACVLERAVTIARARKPAVVRKRCGTVGWGTGEKALRRPLERPKHGQREAEHCRAQGACGGREERGAARREQRRAPPALPRRAARQHLRRRRRALALGLGGRLLGLLKSLPLLRDQRRGVGQQTVQRRPVLHLHASVWPRGRPAQGAKAVAERVAGRHAAMRTITIESRSDQPGTNPSRSASKQGRQAGKQAEQQANREAGKRQVHSHVHSHLHVPV